MEKNMEKVLETMRKIKTQETIKIIQSQIGDINIKEDYNKIAQNNKVNNVKYLGSIKINNEEKDIYILTEQREITKEGKTQTIEIEKYVTEDLEQIAGNNKSDQYNKPLVTEKYKDQKEQIENQLQELNIEEPILDLNEMENERIEQISKSLGIKPEEIESIDEIDLEQLIEEQEKEIEQEDKEQEEPKKEEKEEEQETLTEKQLDGLQIKEETKLNQQIKGQTLEQKLGLKEHGITDGVKLARVSTASLNPHLEKANTQVDAFVVIRKDNTAVVLGEDILEPDNRLGTNPTGTDLTINNDGTVKQETMSTSYRIVNGNGKDYLKTSYDEISGKEIKYSMYSPQKNDYVDVELETSRTKRQNTNVHEFMKDKGAGTDEAKKIIERDEEHGQCEEKDVTVIDNDKNNDSHTHEIKEIEEDEYIPDTNIKWRDFANSCGYRGTDWKEKTLEKWNTERTKSGNEEKSNEELAKDIQEEIEDQYTPGMERR